MRCAHGAIDIRRIARRDGSNDLASCGISLLDSLTARSLNPLAANEMLIPVPREGRRSTGSVGLDDSGQLEAPSDFALQSIGMRSLDLYSRLRI
jgi:hypothetical protein